MKNIVNEELNYMKYLFDYQRGKVISEQTTNKVLGKDGCEEGFYRDCTTKACIKTPKSSVIVYSQEEFNKEQKIYQISKEHNRKGLHHTKVMNDWVKKNGWTRTWSPQSCPTSGNFGVGLPNGKEKVVLDPQSTTRIQKRYKIINGSPKKCENGISLSSYKNDLEKKGLKLSGMCVQICNFTYFPLLKIIKPILGCLETSTTEPVKIENINQITKVEDFPKEFILSGKYRCDGTNGLGNSAEKSTFEQQCMKLPQNLKTNQRLASWEIKFPPNVAGNPNTVPVTRWNFIWNSEGKITEVKMQNFNKIGEKEQIVYNNLLNQKTSSENLKAFMKIAHGDDTYYKNNVGNFM